MRRNRSLALQRVGVQKILDASDFHGIIFQPVRGAFRLPNGMRLRLALAGLRGVT
jgi:hypothetical protein